MRSDQPFRIYMPIRLIILLLISIGIVAGCSSCSPKPGDVVKDSSVFRLKQHEGFYGTHSSSYTTLLFKDSVVWNGIYEIGGTWGDKILFLAATTESDIRARNYRLLFYQPEMGVVDIHDELLAVRAEMMMERKISESSPAKRWQFSSDGIIIGFDTTPPSEIKIPLSQVTAIAKKIRLKNQKSIFAGNEFSK